MRCSGFVETSGLGFQRPSRVDLQINGTNPIAKTKVFSGLIRTEFRLPLDLARSHRLSSRLVHFPETKTLLTGQTQTEVNAGTCFKAALPVSVRRNSVAAAT